jgi:hypothetical protein
MPSLLLAAVLPLLAAGFPVQGRVLADGAPVAGAEVSLLRHLSAADLPCGAGRVRACYCPDLLDGFIASLQAFPSAPLATSATDAFGYFSLEVADYLSWPPASCTWRRSRRTALAGRSWARSRAGLRRAALVAASFREVAVEAPASVRPEHVLVTFGDS